MKRAFAWLVALMVMLAPFGAFAEMGVQIIGGPETENEPISLDDIKVDVAAEIPDYALINMTAFEWVDQLWSYPTNRHDGYDCFSYNSGNDAEYAIVRMDITNLTMSSKDFLSGADVKAVYDDKYEYQGWMYQCNYDYGTKNNANPQWNVIDPTENFSIGSMYAGHYAFGCTLPNAVKDGKASLRIVITIDENEITYNIRK